MYSPDGGKQVVQVDLPSKGGCLSGVICTSAEASEVTWTIRSSVWINFVLCICKVYAFVVSGSLAVLASLVDSAIDLLGQGTLMVTNHLASAGKIDEYPAGRGKLEPVGVMVCAVVMGMASMEVISTASLKLFQYWGSSEAPLVELNTITVWILVGIIVLKAGLWVWCSRVHRRHPHNDSVKAIAQDNLNDVLSNIVALIAPEATLFGHAFWVADPLAGILISVYIIWTWVVTGYEQVEMIVGKRADIDFLRKIQEIAQVHHDKMVLDQLNAYHFGPRYLVELEVVMPESTTLRESHDVGIQLQHKIELMEEVARCFVHIDYQIRVNDDHDPEVPIEEKLWGGPRRSSPRAEDMGKALPEAEQA